jgi:hypothetical protein
MPGIVSLPQSIPHDVHALLSLIPYRTASQMRSLSCCSSFVVPLVGAASRRKNHSSCVTDQMDVTRSASLVMIMQTLCAKNIASNTQIF